MKYLICIMIAFPFLVSADSFDQRRKTLEKTIGEQTKLTYIVMAQSKLVLLYEAQIDSISKKKRSEPFRRNHHAWSDLKIATYKMINAKYPKSSYGSNTSLLVTQDKIRFLKKRYLYLQK